MNEYYGSFQEIESIIEESNATLTNVNELFENLANSLAALIMGAYLSIWIFMLVLSVIMTILYYVLSSIPVYTLAKRAGYKYAWLAWVPFCHKYCRLFVLCETVGNKPFVPNIGNFKIANRRMTFLAHFLIYYFGSFAILIVVTLLSFILPGIGYFSSILALLPGFACSLIEYVYFRDFLDIYKENKKSNNTTAIIVSVIDYVLVGDFLRTCFLYTLIKKQPLPVNEIDV